MVAAADGVSHPRVGQRVFGTALSGGLAELALVEAEDVYVLPERMDPSIAAGFELNYGTSFHGLVDLASLREGETLLVLGAAGRVGLSAVAIGRALGARVVACASAPERRDACEAAGAELVLDSSCGAAGLRDALASADLRGNVDVVFDVVGGELSEVAMRALGWGGRFLVVGFASGGATPKAAIPSVPLNLALLNERRVLGVFWGAWKSRDAEGRAANRANVQEMLRMISEGKLKPPPSRVYPFEKFRDAFDDMAKRRAIGKLVVSGPAAAPAARL